MHIKTMDEFIAEEREKFFSQFRLSVHLYTKDPIYGEENRRDKEYLEEQFTKSCNRLLIEKIKEDFDENLFRQSAWYKAEKAMIEEKARHDWLREEIVKLEGMKQEIPTYLNKRGHHTNSAHRKIKYNQALDEVIHRYQSELDQPTDEETMTQEELEAEGDWEENPEKPFEIEMQ